MSLKSDILPLLQDLFKLIKTPFTTNKYVRTDNARNFFQIRMVFIHCSQGVIHKSSCIHTPNTIEKWRENIDIFLMWPELLNCSLMCCSFFWTMYFLTRKCLINRLPAPILNNNILFEILFINHYPYHIKGIWMFCSATTLRHRDKLAPRVTPCVFMGYLFAQKGYEL